MIDGIRGALGSANGLLTGLRKPEGSSRFEIIDANCDGKIDRDELGAHVDALAGHAGRTVSVDEAFSRFDADGDGFLSRDEESKAAEQFMRNAGPPPGPPRGRQGPPPPAMAEGLEAYATNSRFSALSIMDLLETDTEEGTSYSSVNLFG